MIRESMDQDVRADTPLAAMRTAVVLAVTGRDAVIEDNGVVAEAATAVSCMVQPMAGDTVIYAETRAGRTFILAIVERPGEPDVTVSFPGNATFTAANGGITVSSRQSVSLVSQGGLHCFSDQAVHHAREALVDYGNCTARGRDLQANFTNVRMIGEVITTIAAHCLQRFKNYFRRSAAHDQVRAGNISRSAEGLYAVDSRQTVMVSSKDTKIDGERIHMG